MIVYLKSLSSPMKLIKKKLKAMKELPTEVFIPVISLLNTSDKLECLLVCKRWHGFITENILYKELSFNNNTADFYNAIALFHDNRKLGMVVRKLAIDNCELDVHTILSLPKYFPNLRDFQWTESDSLWEIAKKTANTIFHYPPVQVYARYLGKWKSISNISTNIENTPFVTMLLASATFTDLTSISISFQRSQTNTRFQGPSITNIRSLVKQLIDNIGNAPTLETLHLYYLVIDLDDMEKLHTAIPNLEKLFMENCRICEDEERVLEISRDKQLVLDHEGFQFVNNTVRLKSLTIYFDDSFPVLNKVIPLWLTYISCKYDNLNDVDIGMINGYDISIPNEEFKLPMLKIISKIKRISSYKARLYPFTQDLINIIDCNKGKLKEISIYSNEARDIQNQLKYVNKSRQAKTVEKVNIVVADVELEGGAIFNWIISGMSAHLLNLSSLHIEGCVRYTGLVLILRLLVKLEDLSLSGIEINPSETIRSKMATKGRIKSLKIVFYCDDDIGFESINTVIRLILQSCPLLENFTITGDFSYFDYGTLNLCFFYHDQLKSINVNIEGVEYYTFSWEDGKQELEWADYNNPLETTDDARENFHIDIVWRATNVALNLAKAPVITLTP